MKPIDPAGVPGDRVIIAEHQPEYRPLPARIQRYSQGGTAVYTRWRLTFRERLAVLFGRCIDIDILTFGKPLQPLQPLVQGMEVEAE